MRIKFLSLVLLLISHASFAQQPAFTDDELDVVHLQGPVYMLRSNTKMGNPSTTISIGKDGVLLVDPNLVKVGPLILKEIQKLGGGNVKYVLCTHFHGDHSEGMEFFGATSTIITPHNQRSRLMTQSLIDTAKLKQIGWPRLTFDSTLSIHFNDEEIKVFTPPFKNGHTDGDAFIYFSKSNVLCIGDYLMVDKFPIIDVENGGDIEGFLNNIDYIVKTFPKDVIIVPGHGYFRPDPIMPVTLQKLKENTERLRESIKIIRDKMKAGKSVDEIKKESLPAFYSSYDQRPRYVTIDKWIQAVYTYYSKKP